MLRADYRGSGRISAYQVMGLLTIPYACGLMIFSPDRLWSAPDIAAGMASLWRPAILLFLQGIWIAIFLYTGRSTVTGARMTFRVHGERI